jgi:hypothetical protein
MKNIRKYLRTRNNMMILTSLLYYTTRLYIVAPHV